MAYRTSDLILALTCAFLGSVKGLLVSEVASVGAVQIFGLRALGSACFLLPIVVFLDLKLWHSRRDNWTLLARSLAGGVAVLGYYAALVRLSLAQASLLFYATPLFAQTISHCWLGERCGRFEVLSVALSVGGVALVCVPDLVIAESRDSSDVTAMAEGVASALVGAVAQAVALAVCRTLTHVHPAVVSLWWATIGALMAAAITAAHGQVQQLACGGRAAGMVVAVAAVGFVSEMCLVGALRHTDAGLVSVAITSEIVWAFALQMLVTGEMPTLLTVIGGCLIVVSVLVPSIAHVTRCCEDTSDVTSPDMPQQRHNVVDSIVT